jgi:Putative restriction endonuclease
VPASTSPEDRRQSYVVWQEGVSPFLMVELLSPGTEAEDLGSATRVSPEVSSGACPARQTLRVVGKPPTKWQVYEQILQVPYYAVFDEFSSRFRMFCLQDGQYIEAKISGQGFWLSEIELGLGIWAGSYQGMTDRWLRWYDRAGNWIPTHEENELLANQRADLERQNADRERQRADLLAAKLRELGIDVD